MKKYLILILTLLISCNAFAANQKVKIYDTDNNKSKLVAQGTDGQVLTQQADGSVAFENAGAGSEAAPNSVNYLVGTSDAGLSGEIVVGTSSLSLANLGNKLLGGTNTTTDLYLQTTSGVGTTGADMHFLVGNNGATEAVTILNSGNVGIGDTSPDGLLDIGDGTNDTVIGTTSMTFTGTAKPKGRIIILGEALTCRTTSGCTDAGQKETTTNKVNYRPKAFGNASDQYAQVRFTMPENYDGGTVQVEYEWTTDTADTVSAGGVAFYFQLMSITNDDAIDTAFGTAVEVNDDFIASGDLHKSATSSAITISGSPAGGDAVWLQIYRNVADSDDDLSGGVTNAAFLDKVTLIYGIDALSTED